MDGVYNRKLFAKKSEEARNKLRQLGGVESMSPPIGGILASSPELMQAAAMRRPVALPATTAPAPAPAPAPMPQTMAQMLPPSSPIPNVAGIPQAQTQAPAPRPVAPKPQPVRFEGGGPVTLAEFGSYMGPVSGAMASSFQNAFEFAQKALTTADPAELGLPEGTNMSAPAELLKDPNAAAEVAIERAVPKEEQTGDIKTDLRKAAVASGVEAIPVEAEIDELNKAIFGAGLAGAIAGNYVNPNTGQELRPTSGKRIADAALQGLAVQRETEERRAKQEAALAAANIKARASAKTGKGFLETSTGKSMLKFVESQGGKDMLTDAQINEYLTNAYGADMVNAFRAALEAQAAAINSPTAGGTPAPTQTVDPVETADPAAFVPTMKLQDGTPVMKRNGKWVDAEGNDRSNG
ncbi:hypothetical protein OAM26_04140 [Porticoccaceae bacterium]|nr:hypothetical protein [Porticoccaceae bacterium]